MALQSTLRAEIQYLKRLPSDILPVAAKALRFRERGGRRLRRGRGWEETEISIEDPALEVELGDVDVRLHYVEMVGSCFCFFLVRLRLGLENIELGGDIT